MFVSYRRGDTAGHAGRLFDRLCERFGKSRVFMDLDSIAPGADFARSLDEAVGSCDIFLAVIGMDWLDTTGTGGQPRLHSPGDFVRLELRTALNRDVRVVPVLVCGASLPSEGDLPEDCRGLVHRQAFELRDGRWQADTNALCDALSNVSVESPASQRKERPRVGLWLLASAIVGLGLGGSYFVSQSGSSEPKPNGTGAELTISINANRPTNANRPGNGAEHWSAPRPSLGPSPSASVTASAPVSVDAPSSPFELAGSWLGSASENGGPAFRIELVVLPACEPGKHCGTISVSHVPCYGQISLLASTSGDYEFNVDRFDAGSGSKCQPGGGEHFRLVDGVLTYTTSYGARGTLKKKV